MRLFTELAPMSLMFHKDVTVAAGRIGKDDVALGKGFGVSQGKKPNPIRRHPGPV